MSKQIIHTSFTERELAEIAAKSPIPDMQVGDLLIYERYHDVTVVKITGFRWDKRKHNGKKIEVLVIEYAQAKDWECTEWEHYGSNEVDGHEWESYGYIKVPDNDIQKYRAEALSLIESGDFSAYSNKGSDALSTETGLLHGSSKDLLIGMQKELERKKQHAEVVKMCVELEMQRRKQELENIRDQMGVMVSNMRKQVEKIMRVIITIEIYLGIEEEIFQLQSGTPAPAGTPISLRQAVLYADEEYGHWLGGGIDFRDQAVFDKWILENDNYKRLLPEPKGVVVLKPRRYDKKYGGDPWGDAQKNAANARITYTLIRNGDNLFRIFTEHIEIHERLFPRRDELQKLMLRLAKDPSAYDENMYDRDKEKDHDRAERELYFYKKRAILIQGLIDRTEVFHPLPEEKINMFDLDTEKNHIQFIYDDEMLLPSGRLPFEEWKKQINSKITKGSRILITGHYAGRYKSYMRPSDFKDRLYYYCSDHNTPPLPAEGVYQVEEYTAMRTIDMPQVYADEFVRIWKEQGKVEGVDYRYKVDGGYTAGWEEHDSNHADDELGYRLDVPKVPRVHINHKDHSKIVMAKIELRGPFKEFTIMHNPEDEGWRGGWGEQELSVRKNRIRFRIYKSDYFVLNYDQIDLDDVDFYMTSRVDRPNYLDMLPVLERIKNMRLKELEQEGFFKRLLLDRNMGGKLSEDVLKARIDEGVEYFKYKNKWKRPIAKDDALALRMIEKRILSKNYEHLKVLQEHTV